MTTQGLTPFTSERHSLVERILAEAGIDYARRKSRQNYQAYEKYKKQIMGLYLDANAYESACKALAKVLGV
jgi:hypothetical protein